MIHGPASRPVLAVGNGLFASHEEPPARRIRSHLTARQQVGVRLQQTLEDALVLVGRWGHRDEDAITVKLEQGVAAHVGIVTAAHRGWAVEGALGDGWYSPRAGELGKEGARELAPGSPEEVTPRTLSASPPRWLR